MASSTREGRGRNLLLDALRIHDPSLIDTSADFFEAQRGHVLFEPGQSVEFVHFPCDGTVSTLTVGMRDGRSAKTATIGREGAIGGVVSHGHLPAFSRGIVQIGGLICRVEASRLQASKHRSLALRNLLTRYSDCFLAQMLQSVACNALHPIEQRCARWLLTLQDRINTDSLPITQDLIADMLGVQRTYVTRVLQTLRELGPIAVARGKITIVDRPALERSACECYLRVNAHFTTVMGSGYNLRAIESKRGQEMARAEDHGPCTRPDRVSFDG